MEVIFIACYSPMLMKKYLSSDNEVKYKFLGKSSNEAFASCYSLDNTERQSFKDGYIMIPCGNCIGCRLDYAETWADRLLCESFDNNAFFITLTYNDENLPISINTGFETICNYDIDIFLRDLRNKFRDKNIRYALSTEYGGITLRPHAHLILFGLSEEDLELSFYKVSPLGYPSYTSKVLEEVWYHGFNCVMSACYESMAYTARYILKKQKGELGAEYDAFDIEKPTFRMSRRPGIAYKWLLENYKQLYDKGYIPIPRSVKPTGKITPNRYFDKIVKDLDEELYNFNKSKREESSFNMFHDKLNTSSMTLDNVTAFYEFERDNFLKKNKFQRENKY